MEVSAFSECFLFTHIFSQTLYCRARQGLGDSIQIYFNFKHIKKSMLFWMLMTMISWYSVISYLRLSVFNPADLVTLRHSSIIATALPGMATWLVLTFTVVYLLVRQCLPTAPIFHPEERVGSVIAFSTTTAVRVKSAART